jgi:molybdate-binding protein/DNA-binding XRE family transcriptional regulator
MILSQGNQLAQCRRLRDWSQATLAEKSGVSRTEVSAVETGRLVPSVAVALRLAAALNESVESVFGGQAAPAAADWAWAPNTDDGRCWIASVQQRLLAFPVEQTAAGSIPHDGRGAANEAGAPPDRTLLIAGCDPMVGLLAYQMAVRHDIRVIPLLRSSGEALDLLKRGLVHVAGLHMTDAAGRSTNETAVKSAVGGGHRLLHQMRWDSGIAVGNTRKEQTAAALLRAKVRWINREEGSAARRALDFLLASRPRPVGYGHVARDHRSVAAIVSSGWAEAGICVKPAATEAGVRFIPLQREAYELCVADAACGDPRVEALIATLQSTTYRRQIAEVPGCTSHETGTVRLVA